MSDGSGDTELASFTWLTEETERVRWKQFFVFRRNCDAKKVAQIARRIEGLPMDYLGYLREFGESLLFRNLEAGWYNLSVLEPKEIQGYRGEGLVLIGFFLNGGYAYLRKSEKKRAFETGVFEGTSLAIRRVANVTSFGEWLRNRFIRAKTFYDKKTWSRVVGGAAPFTKDELRRIHAIGQFSVKRIGESKAGNVRFRVHNGSEVGLNYLALAAHAPERLQGTVHLDVSGIGPGETKVIEHDCYKSLVPAAKIELTVKPPPKPEEREMFLEFRSGQR